MKVDIKKNRKGKVCWRCGHPKKRGAEVCDHCKEAIEFMLHGRK